ncbi:MAG: bifunctional adenosylcobinamide kinase/adenosylcobinamide-phosphate guanylyltransferase [Trichlorobacter sp.]|nr:bifunctional adenosylcobinamide kinase/adenosylcobinamide-phosphate guanylyltransferase [Trichlorobacter sp.]
MSKTIFISGGVRSGKSRLAEEITRKYGAPIAYIATGSAGDAEMAARIARHQSRRGCEWNTIEEPFNLPEAIKAADRRFNAVLVDCITLWLTNLLLKYEATMPVDKTQPAIMADLDKLISVLQEVTIPVIIVSNEVGLGIMPDNALARTFCDLAGEANRVLAATADEVHMMFSGIPLKLKG